MHLLTQTSEARPRQRRQADQLRGGPPKPSRTKGAPASTAGYSHIQTVSQPEALPDPTTHGCLTPLSFVKKSFQEEINEGISLGFVPPKPPIMGMAPLSFAQAVTATMIPATTSRRAVSINSAKTGGAVGGSMENNVDITTSDQPSARSVCGILKAAKKKEELTATGESEEGAHNDAGRVILPAGGVPTLSGNKQLQTPTPLYVNPTSPTSPVLQHIAAAYASPSRSFQVSSPPSHQKSQKSRRYTSETERSIIHKEDSDETKEKYQNIMARLDDVFDAEEWDSELLDGTTSNSPEHLAVEPQRVTYTTVGSVAKPNVVPTFNPPVRIQREGANRRMPIIPTMRAADNYFARQHSMSGPGFALPSMNSYMVQHNQQHQPFTPQAGINMSLLESLNLTLTDQEKEILDNFGHSPASVRSGNLQTQSHAHQMGAFNSDDQFITKKLIKEETYGQNSCLPGSAGLAGLNKMQTLQRLAQFENPAQGFAKERLAEFKAVKMQQQQSAENGLGLNSQVSRFDINGMQRQSSNGQMSQYRSENENPLQGGRRLSYDNSYEHSQYGGAALSVPPGYPQPLTAGPPGQRRDTVSVSRFNWIGAQQTPNNGNMNITYVTRENSNSPWFRDGFVGYDTHRSDTFRSLPSEEAYIRDTASAVDIQQYYPAGFPMGFQMRRTRTMSERERQKHLLSDEEFKMIEKVLTDEMDNKRWYGGLDRFGMTVNDHVNEFEMREKAHQPGPIQRPTTEFLAARRAVSVAEIEKMTLPQIAEPLVASVFGTLLAYADKIVRPENRKLLSKFDSSPAWALDTSPEGRKSIFGDDWVAPPKRLGRDPRYQPSPLSEVWGNDNQGRFNY